MLRRINRSYAVFSLFPPTKPSKTSPLHALQFHTIDKAQNSFNTFINLLQCHPNSRLIKQIHARILIEGSSSNSFLATHLVKSYAKAGNLHSAHLVFESVQNKSVFLWNAIIRSFSRNELWVEIAELYKRMEEEKIEPDNYTLPFVIKAFSVLSDVDGGKRLHSLANRIGLIENVFVATGLIEMYIQFDELELAFDVFDKMSERDVVTWTSMISGYVEHGNYKKASTVFRDMRLGDVKPNWVTILGLIPACNYSVHGLVVKLGVDYSVEVETAILDMYAKCGDIYSAFSLFMRMLKKTLVSFTVMVVGYTQNGYANEALSVFYQMLKTTEFKPDFVIAFSVIQACAQMGTLYRGEMIHGYVIQSGLISEIQVETTLIDLYSKCGSLDAAQRFFDGIQNPNLITWSALISGYGCHGFGSKSLDLFEEMEREGFTPDETAFLSVLSACSHSGLVNEGKEYFNLMVEKYKVIPQRKHYSCMVDLLGRAGFVEEAQHFIEKMPIEPDTDLWGALLSSCRIKGNVEVAEYVFGKLFKLEPDNTDYYVLLANVYAKCGIWNKVSKLRSLIRRQGEKKTPGCSLIELNCRTHAFFAGDTSHPEWESINLILEMIHFFASDKPLICC